MLSARVHAYCKVLQGLLTICNTICIYRYSCCVLRTATHLTLQILLLCAAEQQPKLVSAAECHC